MVCLNKGSMDRNLFKSGGNLNRKRRVMSIETIRHKIRYSTVQNRKKLDIKAKTKKVKEMAWWLKNSRTCC